jgi:glutamate-1-semialdehyde aminotransferase
LGTAFAAQRYGVTPDMIVFAKGITSGTVPMGGVIAALTSTMTFMDSAGEGMIELFPRLHLFRSSARLRCRARHAQHLSRRGPVRAGSAA